jgi:hypothetical protein
VQGVPDGASWEVYTVLADSPTFYGQEDGPACGGTAESAEATSPAALCCQPGPGATLMTTR